MPAKTRHRPATAPTGCASTAKRTGKPCRQKLAPYSDHCRSHLPPPPNAITAASARMTINGVGWKTWRYGDTAWQLEAWRMYDIIGELRKYANWIGSAVSRCRLYVAEVDQNGEPTQEVKDPKIAALAAGPLGKGPAKDEALRLLGVNLAVVGEAYVVAEAKDGKDDDLWYVVSGSEIQQAGGRLVITRPALLGMGGELDFREGVDLLIRCWTPHPRRTMWADSSVRAAIPVLRKIEATMKRSFAELDSRLTGAGLLLLPQSIDFPRGDGVPAGINGLAHTLMNTMATSIEDRASSEAMVPILATVPDDAVDKIKLITFWSELSDKLQDMEDAAIRRLAVELDLPPEVLMGIGSTNHWNAWAVEEATIKIFIEPVLSRIAEALDHGYLDAALEFMGLDPTQYTYAFDTAALAVQPDRSGDAMKFHDALMISDDALLRAGNYDKEDAPTPEERARRQIEKALPTKPELLNDPSIRELLGLPPQKTLPAAPAATPGMGLPEIAAAPTAEEAGQGMPATKPEESRPQSAVTAAALFPLANYAVMHALGLAGSRLVPHGQRDRWPGTLKHELYVRHGAVSTERAMQALRGAWDNLVAAAGHDSLPVDVQQVQRLLDGFCLELLTRGMAYDPQMLRDLLRTAARRLAPPVSVGAGV